MASNEARLMYYIVFMKFNLDPQKLETKSLVELGLKPEMNRKLMKILQKKYEKIKYP